MYWAPPDLTSSTCCHYQGQIQDFMKGVLMHFSLFLLSLWFIIISLTHEFQSLLFLKKKLIVFTVAAAIFLHAYVQIFLQLHPY